MRILTLNAGSNSLKFEIISTQPDAAGFGDVLVSGSYDNIGKADATFSLLKQKKTVHQNKLAGSDYGHAVQLLLEWIDSGKSLLAEVAKIADLDRIGHRIVHGGDLFSGPALITNEVVSQIESLQDLAPLHNSSALQAVHASRKIAASIPMVAVFDTVFHQTIPEEAALYPLPLYVSRRLKIRRYGFHGISHRYMMLRYAQTSGRQPGSLNLVTLHLEGGSSACAIRGGKSVDNSMGFTPLEGLMMGTRCGDIDPAIVTYLMSKESMSVGDIETFLNKKCGLLGVSGKSADTRELVKDPQDSSTKLALDMFSYRVKKYVGAYLAVSGPTEAIIVGGGIGENMPQIRRTIFSNLEFWGVAIDPEKNGSCVDKEGIITTDNSRIPVWVIPTRENLMMAHDVAAFPVQNGNR